MTTARVVQIINIVLLGLAYVYLFLTKMQMHRLRKAVAEGDKFSMEREAIMMDQQALIESQHLIIFNMENQYNVPAHMRYTKKEGSNGD